MPGSNHILVTIFVERQLAVNWRLSKTPFFSPPACSYYAGESYRIKIASKIVEITDIGRCAAGCGDSSYWMLMTTMICLLLKRHRP